MIDELIGILSICVASVTAILSVWDPMYLYPVLPILQTLSAILWLSYGIVIDNMILIVGSAICLVILVFGILWRCASPRKIYTRVHEVSPGINK